MGEHTPEVHQFDGSEETQQAGFPVSIKEADDVNKAIQNLSISSATGIQIPLYDDLTHLGLISNQPMSFAEQLHSQDLTTLQQSRNNSIMSTTITTATTAITTAAPPDVPDLTP